MGDVAGRIGARAGITIIVRDPDIARRRSPGVRGRFPVRQALKRALAGTGAEALFLDEKVVQVIRARVKPERIKRPPTPTARPPAPPVEDEEPEAIVVTGSKQNVALDRYPGSVKIVQTDLGWTTSHGFDGVSALTRLIPSISSTNLGQGREKVFIRGIADSSFSGPTQAATGQYLGDVRLTYNAPDPALDVYDMERIEVLVGPQAPLYGAGSLGGVIRLVPNTPELTRIAGSASANIGSTRFGGVNSDGAIMANLPIVEDRVGVRVVLSAGEKAGYIDAPAQGLENINRLQSGGHRIALRAADLAGWMVDAGHVSQSIRSATGQYAERSVGKLARNEPFPQPFQSDYRLAYLTASRTVGTLDLVTTTSFVDHELKSVFDASALLAIPLRMEERNDISIFSHETRLSGGNRTAPWVLGGSVIYSRSRGTSRLAIPEGEFLEINVVNDNLDAALFGQFTHRIGSSISTTLGGRLSLARNRSYSPELVTIGFPPIDGRGARFSSTIALDWHPAGPLSAYVRHDQGYRPGGLTAVATETGFAASQYRADTIDTYELGVRIGEIDRSRVTVRAALFASQWRNVQADLVDRSGGAFTANVGEGRINGVDGEVRWRVASPLLITFSAFLNDSRLKQDALVAVGNASQALPNVAGAGGRLAVAWERRLSRRVMLSGNAAVRYVGKSRLGVGTELNIPQGDYAVADVGGRVLLGTVALSVNVDNLTETRGNTFAYGNRFSFARRDQVTPLRPRTIRVGIDVRF